MQTRLTLTSNELTDLVVQVRASFTYEKLLRGFDAFKSQSVNYFQITEKSLILARVKMPEFYDIQLDLDFLSISTCTCSDGGFCEHMAAVFFAVYQQHNQSPDLFIHECAAVIKELETVQEMKAAKAKKAQINQAMQKTVQDQITEAAQVKKVEFKRAVENASSDSNSSLQVLHQETDDVEGWHRYFNSKWANGLSDHGQGGDVKRLVRMLCKSAASWDSTLRQLYEIHVLLFALTQLEISYKKSQHSYLHYLYQSHISEMAFQYFEEISELIANIKLEKNIDTYRNILEATTQFLEHEFCHESIAVVDTYALYNMLWGNLLGVEPFKQREKTRLDEVLQKPPQHNSDFSIHARAFHDWLDGQDKTATERLQNVEALNIFNLLGLLAVMHENKAWNRLLYWLRWLLPYIQSQGEEVEEYLHFWRVLSKRQPLEDEFLQTMATLLPYIAYTAKKYSRLRSFQEELKKGKVVS